MPLCKRSGPRFALKTEHSFPFFQLAPSLTPADVPFRTPISGHASTIFGKIVLFTYARICSRKRLFSLPGAHTAARNGALVPIFQPAGVLTGPAPAPSLTLALPSR